MRLWRAPSDGRQPALSVVVPVHNVGRYLAETMRSILAQPVREIEVLLVDDGSTDETAEVARTFAARDRRVRLLTQEHSGVSVARNYAVSQCRGRFLTFADGDDILPRDAWSRMLATLEWTRSDFAVGKAERTDGEHRFVTPLMHRNHREEQLGATIGELPLMLADVFVWNKVFRTEFFTGNRIWFPERTRYQDQVAMTQAFLAARAFDVLTEVVYVWRVRPDRTSATQRRADLDNLVERLTTKQMTVDSVEARGDDRLARVLFGEILPIDMWEHFRASVRGDGAYWRTLVEGTRALWNDATLPFTSTAIPAQQRLMGWLVQQDRRADLALWVDLLDQIGPVYDEDVLVHPWATEVELRRWSLATRVMQGERL